MGHGEGRSGNRDAPHTAGAENKAAKRPATERIRDLWPDIWALVRPRRGLLLLGLILIVVKVVCGLVLPLSTKYLIDTVVGKRRIDMLPWLTLTVLGATAIQGFAAFTVTQVLSIEGQKLIAELRRKVQEHIGRLPVTFYDANKTGQLVSRIMNDVEGIRNLIGTGLVEFFGGVLTAVISLVLLLRISVPMTCLALAIVVTFAVAVSFAFKTIRPIFRERGRITAEVTGRLTESLGGVRVIKGYHAEDREAAVFTDGVIRLLTNVRKSLTAMSVMSLSATVLMGIVGAIIMYLGAHSILGGSMTLGEYATFVALLAFLIAPIVGVVSIGTQLTEALAGLERTRQVLAERPEDEDPGRTHVIGPIQGHVVFDNVTFAYVPGRDVLHEISFASTPGTVTAFVGPSGSGKSTTIGLISAFYKPTGGHIYVDGVDLDSVQLPGFRGQLGVVLQETFLFDGTIRENIVFSRPNATNEAFLDACRIARVDEFAEKLETGYDTVVGERGVKLSGGQRQRLSIARAILADPRILILDEATSSLDSESEAMIQHGLSHLMKGRTTFVIAHRLSTIRRADQILVVEDGRIAERGTHPELFALRGRYWDMYTRQHALDDNLFLAPGEGDSIPEPIAPAPVLRAEGGASGRLPRI
jgi:subfamily B ATP-binding cassette protein MsbA